MINIRKVFCVTVSRCAFELFLIVTHNNILPSDPTLPRTSIRCTAWRKSMADSNMTACGSIHPAPKGWASSTAYPLWCSSSSSHSKPTQCDPTVTEIIALVTSIVAPFSYRAEEPNQLSAAPIPRADSKIRAAKAIYLMKEQ